MNLDRILLKENYTLDDLKKEKRIIYFDIDSTLGGSTLHHGLYSYEKYIVEKKEQFELFKKKFNVSFSYADFRVVDITCLAMFLVTLKETNSVGFCISSWVTSCRFRAENANMNAITLIEEVFKETFPEWESGIIVGGCTGDSDFRGSFCKELSEYINADYFIIDDAHHEYSIKDSLIEVDGHCGYNYKNHSQIISKWT